MMKTEHTLLRSAQRPAFTLVELLVVITVIAMLAGLIIPAVNGAREAARRAQCLDRMRQIGIALHTYEKANNGLPGYMNRLPISGDIQLSWATAILAELGESKRYELLSANTPTLESTTALPILLCPSAQKTGQDGSPPPLSFVVNCGPASTSASRTFVGSTVAKFSLFADRRVTAINKKMKLEDIKDGTSHTILLTENLQASTWHNSWLAISANDSVETATGSGDHVRSNDQIASFGFVWNNETDKEVLPTAPAKWIVRINGQRSTSALGGIFYARPSSNHPGLVNMLYADATVRTMNDDVGLGIYLSAVCPDDAAALGQMPGGLDYGLSGSVNPFTLPSW